MSCLLFGFFMSRFAEMRFPPRHISRRHLRRLSMPVRFPFGSSTMRGTRQIPHIAKAWFWCIACGLQVKVVRNTKSLLLDQSGRKRGGLLGSWYKVQRHRWAIAQWYGG